MQGSQHRWGTARARAVDAIQPARFRRCRQAGRGRIRLVAAAELQLVDDLHPRMREELLARFEQSAIHVGAMVRDEMEPALSHAEPDEAGVAAGT
jgi:hypothetical protein